LHKINYYSIYKLTYSRKKARERERERGRDITLFACNTPDRVCECVCVDCSHANREAFYHAQEAITVPCLNSYIPVSSPELTAILTGGIAFCTCALTSTSQYHSTT